jgi:copper chaperone CopZ
MRTLLILLFLLPAFAGQAQDKKKLESISIRTSVVCGTCKKTIEEDLLYAKGVKVVEVDVDANLIHVDYDPRKTDPDGVRVAVTRIGYDADGLPANAKAFLALPACCQRPDKH